MSVWVGSPKSKLTGCCTHPLWIQVIVLSETFYPCIICDRFNPIGMHYTNHLGIVTIFLHANKPGSKESSGPRHKIDTLGGVFCFLECPMTPKSQKGCPRGHPKILQGCPFYTQKTFKVSLVLVGPMALNI